MSNRKALAERLRLRAISLPSSDPLVDDLTAAYDALMQQSSEETDAAHQKCLDRIAVLMALDPAKESHDGIELDHLATAVELYESLRYPLKSAPELNVEQMGEAGDELAHQSVYTPFHQRWWQARGGHDKCTVCRPSATTQTRRGYKVIALGEPCLCGDHPGGKCDKPCCSVRRDLLEESAPCDHSQYDSKKHGRRCPCGALMWDAGD